ncbi:hypothetical protein RFN28_29270 [Mesorhizobium sp. VK24D]|uniref:Uncharacterized protein n=1 Tax=Mesorhizobium album TaxID=3072314 RepID=A0ABU4Y6F2_9HYPH|nr:hypothetical protein [Mesorhizobium sp. VK24D]MDX8482519.1 hypothetical protein [Mesorhizobium sp. VK24D]
MLALAQVLRGEDSADASLVTIGDKADPSWRKDAAARHRAARLEREWRLTLQPDYPSPAAFEPRFAEPRSASRPPAGDDPDTQEWKPLIDPMQVVRGITRSPIASPLPAPPVAPAAINDVSRPGFLRALASALRYLVRRGPAEPADKGAVPGESARRVQEARSSHPEKPQQRDVRPPPARMSFAYQPDCEQPDPHDDAYSQPPMPAAASPQADQQSQIDEIRTGLREFREAVRDLTESRTRRRYF